MAAICFYFQVHQPYRLRPFRIFDIGNKLNYFEHPEGSTGDNRQIFRKVAEKSYLPANSLLLSLIQQYPDFKVSFSLSGIFIEQMLEYGPDVLESFRKLIATGNVELLSETYHHSLSFLYSPSEFTRQVRMHSSLLKEIFGVEPRVFRNTELIYNNDLALEVAWMGYAGVIIEGADHILDWRSPNFLYSPPNLPELSLLLKNYKLSDDIAFRFSEKTWEEYPLTAGKFANWISQVNGSGEIVNLFMDYETFGEHQWEDTGIFRFLEQLPAEIYRHPDNSFVTPSEVISQFQPKAELDIPDFISWADLERDLSAWRSNSMQHDALQKVYSLESEVLASKDSDLIADWRRLQTSDHFYYMCTKWFSDGDVHKYFSPYSSPYDAFINYMNVLQDLSLRLSRVSPSI